MDARHRRSRGRGHRRGPRVDIATFTAHVADAALASAPPSAPPHPRINRDGVTVARLDLYLLYHQLNSHGSRPVPFSPF